VITCFLKYTVEPDRLEVFEVYGKKWIALVNKLGGIHHGYLLPSEGHSDIALASFSFPSLAAYEQYRIAASTDPACLEVMEYHRQNKCFVRYERSFFRPVFE
jgi:hypothetical protein